MVFSVNSPLEKKFKDAAVLTLKLTLLCDLSQHAHEIGTAKPKQRMSTLTAWKVTQRKQFKVAPMMPKHLHSIFYDITVVGRSKGYEDLNM